MLKKVLILVLILGCSVALYLSYSFLYAKAEMAKSPIESVPMDAALIIESDNIKVAWSRLAETNLVYGSALNNEGFNGLDNILHQADSMISLGEKSKFLFDNKPTIVSLHSGDGIQFFITTSAEKNLFDELSQMLLNIGTVKQIDLDGAITSQVTLGGSNYFLSYSAPFLMFSSDANLIKKSVNQIAKKESLLNDESFESLRSTASSNLGLHLFINGPRTGTLLSTFLTKEYSELWQSGKVLPEWSLMDFNEKSNTIIVNGLSSVAETNETYKNIVAQEPMTSKSLILLPTDLLSLKRFSLSNPEKFIDDNHIGEMDLYNSTCDCDAKAIFSEWMKGELVTISFGNDKIQDIAHLVGCEGHPNLLGALSSFDVEDTVYKNVYGVDLYKVKARELLELIGVRDTTSKEMFFARMNDYAVFSTYNGLAKIAYQLKASQASIPNNKFINFAQKLMANYSSADVYFSWQSALKAMGNIVKPEYQQDIDNLAKDMVDINGVIWQSSLTKDNKLYHSLAVNTNQGNEQTGAVQKLWNLSLQNNVIGFPQVMKNHQTGTNEVVLQDEEFNLILLSATGKLKWSKPIGEEIIGEIKQIDIYQNGKFQMLFNTANKIHLIDINGNEVTNYPVKLPNSATNPITVFDYDKNGEYRFLIATIDNHIHNYSKDGTKVQGWVVTNTSSIVVNQLRHFVVDGLDYICANDIKGNIYLLNRKGEPRPPSENMIRTNHQESIYFQKGASLASTKFIYLDTLDRLAELPISGTLKTTVLDSSIYNFYQYTTDVDNDKLPEFVNSFGNKFSVFGPDKKLFFSEIFDFDIGQHIRSIGNTTEFTYVADQKKQKIYLYNYQFKPLQDFPQPGSFQSTIGDLNKDGKKELITVLNGKEIIVYTIDQLYGI